MKKIQRPLLLIAGLIVCLLMIRLGVWQLDRASQKQDLVDQRNLVENSPVLDLGDAIQAGQFGEIQRYQPVRLRGNYVRDSTVFVDNKVLDSKVGYQVFTAFKLRASNQHVLVGRGWVSNQGDRSTLPLIDTNYHRRTLEGRINIAPSKPPLWDDDYPVKQGAVWQFIPMVEYSKELQRPVLPVVVELAPALVEGDDPKLTRVWQAVNDSDVGKHKAYALQWFAMSLTLFVIGIVMVVRTPKDQ